MRRYQEILLLVFSISLGLRLMGSDFGFPLLLHPDEFAVTKPALHLIVDQTLDPGFYGRPNHISIYSSAAAYLLVGSIALDGPLPVALGDDALFRHRVSRILVALLGALTVLVAFLIGQRYSTRAGLFAAFLFGFLAPYVRRSHYAAPDVPLVLYLLLVILFAVRYLERPSARRLAGACFFAAVAVAEKYPGAIACLLIGIVVWIRFPRDWIGLLREWTRAALFFFGSLFFCAPYLLINFPKVLDGVLNNARGHHLGHDQLDWAEKLLFYADSYLSASGLLLVLFAGVGAVAIIRAQKSRSVPIFVGLAFWLLLSAVPLHWERWALPMYVTPLLLGAVGLDACLSGTGRLCGWRRGSAQLVLWAAMVLSCVHLVLGAAEATLVLTLEDTRLASLEYAERHHITRENAVFEGYTPLEPTRLRSRLREGDLAGSADYAIVSSAIYNRILGESDRYPAQARLYEQIFALPLLKQFESCVLRSDKHLRWEGGNIHRRLTFFSRYLSRDECYAGPTIRIYRIPPASGA